MSIPKEYEEEVWSCFGIPTLDDCGTQYFTMDRIAENVCKKFIEKDKIITALKNKLKGE